MWIKKIWAGSLRNKILISFLVIVAAFTGIGTIGYRISLKNSRSMTTEAVEMTLRHINREANTVLQEVTKRASEVAADPALQAALRLDLAEDIADVYKERLDFNNWLYYQNLQVGYLDGLYVLGENGAIFHATYSFRKEEYRDTEWYREAVDSRQTLWISPHRGSELGNNLDYEVMSIVIPIQDRASTRILGVVAAEVQMKDLGQIVFEDQAFDGILCIADNNGDIIYYQEPETAPSGEASQDAASERDAFLQSVSSALRTGIAEEDGTANSILTAGEKRYIAVFSDLSDSPWRLLCLVPEAKVLKDTNRLWNGLAFLGILLVLAGVVYSFFASSGIVKPVRAMQTVMTEVEKGDFSVRVLSSGEDEIGDLSRGLNHMIGRIDVLIRNEREAQEKLKIADFNALQSQINPHFLYNTLDSINWMARMGRTDQVEEMISSLTSFLRIGLSRGQTFISLEEELRHVESYFSIQKVRYHSLLNYEIDVPEELYRYRMIKMTLQPLVENALYHGIKEKDQPGTIVLRAEEKEDRLVITVQDDGLGMTPERLLEVREMMETGKAQNKDAYGIINVQRRIRSYFGEEYGLQFESEYGKGTTVTVILPKQEAENTDV